MNSKENDNSTNESMPPRSSNGNLGELASLQSNTNLAQGTAPKLSLSVGTFKVFREIGRGGMGVVYLAEQKAPVKRKVALKVIQHPMLAKTIIDECKSLAAMNHPNVATIHDGGQDDISQLPYFAMEYVDGSPLSTYCREKKISVKGRLELFINICKGVQHAHQKQIIHRDLKPANILVCETDGIPVPKLIDFGLSSDISKQKLTGMPSGTWEYMSPEQANGAQLDARTDIYSLGFILFELMTGTLPINSKNFRRTSSEADCEHNRDLISDSLVPKASEAFRNNKQFSLREDTSFQSGRHLNLLRNELDFVISKAISKKQDDRYQSCTDFANDVQLSMENRVPTAKPKSALYSTKKFLSRNLKAVTSVGAILVLGVVVAFIANYANQKSMELGTTQEHLTDRTKDLSQATSEIDRKKEELLAKQSRFDATRYAELIKKIRRGV